jgi:hypothetical protein
MTKSKWMVAVAVISMVLTFSIAGIASAQLTNPLQANHSAPGSVIVFPKFATGVTPTTNLARSVFEIGVVCPADRQVPGGHGCLDEQGTSIKLALDWVCPGTIQKGASSFCQSVDFELHTTLYGKIQFDANGNVTVAPDSGDVGQGVITEPSCPQGYLIARVVDFAGRPISYNGLIGEVVLRERANSASALAGITFQSPQPTGAVLDNPDGNNALRFDGVSYLMTGAKVTGDVKYDRANPQVITSIILLTLDVRQNNDNPNVRLPVRFYRANESSVSTALHFTCWRSTRLAEIDGGPFNQTRMGEKGLFYSTDVARVASACTGTGCAADGAPITTLGFVQTIERGGQSEYAYSVYGYGPLVPTTFFPLGQ